ncbi:MAG: alpha/beta fold hydrolase [Azospirillaceae bacterium]
MPDAANDPIPGNDHWTTIDGSDLFLFEKPALAGAQKRGTVVFVRGSSMASQPTFDLKVPGRPHSSVMDWFAARGFDAWCFDSRGYGRSGKPPGFNAFIAEGAADIAAATDYIERTRQSSPVCLYGISSGALKAASFAEAHPERVSRLALDAYVWTGKGSPTLAERRKKLPNFKEGERRPIDRAFVQTIFTRDHPGTAEDRVVDAFAEAITALDDSMPNGTYIDMCANLPLNDPAAITAPTLVMRGEYDGIAGFNDLLEFFEQLPNPDKQFTVMPGISHASFQQKNYLMVHDILYGFFARTPPVYRP